MAVQSTLGTIYGHLSQINGKICLKSTGLHRFFDWFGVVLFEGDPPLKDNTIGQHSPVICSKIGHFYGAFSFTYLFGWNIFIRLLTAKKFSYRSFKISNHWKFRINRKYYWQAPYKVRKKWIVWVTQNHEFLQMFPWLLILQSGEFLFFERRRMNWPNRYVKASYEWQILEQFMGKCCPIFSYLDRSLHQSWDIFSMVTCHQTSQHKTNHKSHANQLNSDKFCSLPVPSIYIVIQPIPSLIFFKNRAHCLHTPKMQNFTGISRNIHSKSYLYAIFDWVCLGRPKWWFMHPSMDHWWLWLLWDNL